MTVDTFDYVIVGAGAAGCVLANRLSAEGTYTVCLLEAGPPDNNLLLRIPAGLYKITNDPASKFVWHYVTQPGPGVAGRCIAIPLGKTLGGSTAINGMKYNRGQPSDYDGWAAQGNSGWRYVDVLSYFKRSEKRIGSFDPLYRGNEGLLPITDCDWRHPLYDAFIEAGGSLGLPKNADYNGESQLGFGYYQRSIQNGWRISAARAFLRPVARNKNLDVRTQAFATAVLLEGKRAVAVRYARGEHGPLATVRARREVILACGAANTPKLLQISGIGPLELLSELGVETQHHLPGVGQNLQDHFIVDVINQVGAIGTTNGRSVQLVKEMFNWAVGRPSILSISPSAAYGFINTCDLSLPADLQLDFGEGRFIKKSAELLQKVPMMKLSFFQMRPKSTGYVQACSANPFSPPAVQPNYLCHEDDQQAVVEGLRFVRRMLAMPHLRRYSVSEERPGSHVISHDDLLHYARESGGTGYHLVGTCRMGPKQNATSVVDDQLRVHGLQGLRIADASIMPSIPAGNTMASVYMIAEKAADMILGRRPAQEWPPAGGIDTSTVPRTKNLGGLPQTTQSRFR